MLRLFISTIVFLFLFTISTSPVSAFVNESLDWHLVDGQPKRTIHYCAGVAARYTEENRTVDIEATKPNLPPEWAAQLTAAADALNAANTGWTLQPSQFQFPPCQIFIVLADISEATHGGGVTSQIDTNDDGKVDVVRIVIDQNLEETLQDLPGGQDVNDETTDGWSTDPSEQTRDPVGVLMHEIMHGMRLDHHTDSSQDDESDNDISDPRKPGDHNVELSDEDIRELESSFGMTEKVGMFGVEPQGQLIEFGGAFFDFPEAAFEESYAARFDVNILDGISIPDPLAILGDGDYQHILGSGTVYIRTSQRLAKPVKVSIPYSDRELKGGPGMYVGDLHSYVPPALDENSMRAFKYIKEPFGVEQEGTSHWVLIENSKVDVNKNLVTFETQETGIFGISGKKAPKQQSEAKKGPSGLGRIIAKDLNPDSGNNNLIWLFGILGIVGVSYYFKSRKKK